MMSETFRPVACLVALVGFLSHAAFGQSIPGITTQRVTSGFVRPVGCMMAPGDNNRLFVVEQGGTIQIVRLSVGTKTLFLDISSLLATTGERGLLGLAFHPQYTRNHKFYVNYTGLDAGATHIVEYQSKPGQPEVADPATARSILKFSQPQANHNGGWLGFGPDGYLYIATGDGGGSYDMAAGHTSLTGNAQDTTDNLLGKLLRIDVNLDDFPGDSIRNYGIPATNPFVGIAGDDEIWAYGLRNPWRCSFDRQTGDLYIGDVGQTLKEEIDFQPHGAAGGRNYGWRLREGTVATPMDGIGGTAPAGAIEPLYDYDHGAHALEGNAVTGGYCYRGPITSLQGIYFFGDYVRGHLWSFRTNGSSITEFKDWTTALKPSTGTINNVSSFGEDNWGNLYIVDIDGEIYRVVQVRPSVDAILREKLLAIVTQPPAKSRIAKSAPAAR